LNCHSIRSRRQLADLQAKLRTAARERELALRIVTASRDTTTASAQAEFWMEYVWLDEEYRYALRMLVDYCAKSRNSNATNPEEDSPGTSTSSES
jgi:hypothetical protein